VEDDSDFETDEQVLANEEYQQDITRYIVKNDERKREAIESNADPKRIWAARQAKGENNFKDLERYLYRKALDVGLAK
jgi:hypothetical protein